MKLAKFGIFALALGLFTASCGDSTNEDGTMEDTSMNSTMMEPAAPMTTPDTMVAAPAMGADTMMSNGGTMNSGSTMDTMKK